MKNKQRNYLARGFIAVLAASCCALGNGVQAEELKCEGPFAQDADHQRLVTAFGSRNVKHETIYGVEDLEFQGSTVFGNDPGRRIEVIWEDEQAYRRPASIRFRGTGWSGPKGLHIGASLEEVEAANGKPFTLYGFEWDFGGLVASWNAGALTKLPGGCRLTITFHADEASGEAALLEATGKNEFGSRGPKIIAVKPRVVEIGLVYSR